MGEISACTLQHCYDECKAGGIMSAYGDECSEKVRANCDASSRACRDDEGCLDFTRCMFEKNCLVAPPSASGATAAGFIGRSPGCLNQCTDRIRLYEPVGVGTDAGLVPNATMGNVLCMDLNADVYAACHDGDTSCSGHYNWAYQGASSIRVKLLVTNGAYAEAPGTPLPHIPIRACLQDRVGCAPPLASGTTDKGVLTLTLPTQIAGVAPYFEVTPGAAAGFGKVLYHTTRRLTTDTTISLDVGPWLPEAGHPNYKFASLAPWSKDQGAILIMMRSCAGFSLYNAEARLDDVDGGARPVAYWGFGFELSPQPKETTSAAYFAGVPAGLHTVSVWQKGQKISEEPVVVEADALSQVEYLTPLTEAQGAAGSAP
jgi:hypothetical protein